MDDITELLIANSQGRSSKEIAGAVARLARSGQLPAGQRLPTVRVLAAALGVSASTVVDAWRILSAAGVIDTARRNGTTIRGDRADMRGRFWQVPAPAGATVLDLSTGTPDTELLPELGPVLQRLHADVAISSYMDRPVLDDLEAELRSRWPFEPQSLTIVDGALDAIDRLIGALVRIGDVVLVENPTFPPILDRLDLAGAEVIGLPLDGEGIDPESLERALARQPVAVLLQPRAHNPTGISTSPGRLARLAEILGAAPQVPWIIEDNHSGAIINAPSHSLGQWMPERVVHVHSFSKSHGPDLRLAAVGGAAEAVEGVIDRRRLGPSWTSRLIQHILLTMLCDPKIERQIAEAAEVYEQRRRQLSAALSAHGIAVVQGEGLNMWVPVSDEQRAVLGLALKGIGVASGHPFRVDGQDQHIRVSIGPARTDLEDLAADIAAAAGERDPNQLVM